MVDGHKVNPDLNMSSTADLAEREVTPNGDSVMDTSSTAPLRNTVEKHKMGLWGATSYVVGCMIGSGIFITSKGVLQQTGSIGLSLVVWSVTAVISLLGGMTYTELGTSIRHSGGESVSFTP